MTLSLKYRNFPKRYIRDPRLGHRLGRSFPSNKHFDLVWNQVWLGTNGNGFYGQDTTYNFSKSSNSKRVIVLGGSAAMGLGASSRKNLFVNVLEQKLNSSSKKFFYEVLNCAVGDYSSTQSFLALQTELLAFAPDIIVSLDGFNDFSHSIWGSKFAHGDWLPNTTRSFDDCLYAIQKWENPRNSEVLKYRWKMSKLGTNMRKVLRKGVHKAETHSSHGMVWDDSSDWSIKQEAISWYVNNIKSLIGMSLIHKFRFFHFIQPSYLWTQEKVLTSNEFYYDNLLKSRMPSLHKLAPIYYKMLKMEYIKLTNELQVLGLEDMVKLDNLGEFFDPKQEEVYADSIHYSDVGQVMLATEISYRILRV